ncbi:MAG: lytic transglycosylase domain-containing protein [Deltaproteobacteria bacterium]
MRPRFAQWLQPVMTVLALGLAARAGAQLREAACPGHAILGRPPSWPTKPETIDLPAPSTAVSPEATAAKAPSPADAAASQDDDRTDEPGSDDDDAEVGADGEAPTDEVEAAKAAEQKALLDEQRLRRERAETLGGLGVASPLRGRLEDALSAPEPGESPREEEAIAQELEQFATFDAGQAAARYDIPVELNGQVEQYLRIFQGPVREHFVQWLARVTRYVPRMRETLTREGLPADTVYLSLIESGFNPLAYSHARAAGQWQFIASTGRRFGLRSNFWVDERRDPEKATLAAARYLKELHAQLGSWYLAWAGYNAGAGKIVKAIRRSHTTDFWRLSQGHVLKAETKGYVPKLIAAALISKHPRAFGFDDVQWQPPFEFDEVEVLAPTDLEVVARAAGVDVAAIRALNPALRRYCTPPSLDGAPYRLRVPVGSGNAVRAALALLPKGGTVAFKYYRAARAESLSSIARAFGVPVDAIARMNGLRAAQVKAGRELVIPVPATESTDPRVALVKDERDGVRGFRWRRGRRHYLPIAWVATDDGQNPWVHGPPLALAEPVPRPAASPPSRPAPRPTSPTLAPVEAPPSDAVRYSVAFGDTLWSISKVHGPSLEQLCRWNRIAHPSHHRLYAGEKLWVKSAAALAAPTAVTPAAGPPPGGSYVVRDGDNLWDISRKLRVSVPDLLKWNHLDEDAVLRPGLALALGQAQGPVAAPR